MIPFKKFIPGIAWFFFAMILLCLPGNDLPQTQNWMAVIYFDKWVHTGLFCGMAFLFSLPIARSTFAMPRKRIIFFRIAIAASVWGLATEFIQKYYIPGRSFDLLDWAADSFGASLALFAVIKFFGEEGAKKIPQKRD